MVDERIKIQVIGDADRYAKELLEVTRSLLTVQRAQIALNVAMEAANFLYTEVIGRQVELIDSMNTASKATGISIETINGLRLAAEASGKKMADLIPRELITKLAQVQRGSTEAAFGFEKAGVSAEELSAIGFDTDATLRLLVDRLSKIEDPSERATAAFLTMGPAGQQMLSAFDNLEQLENFVELGRQFGARVGPDAVAAAGEWQKATAALNLALEDASASLFDAVGPTASKLVRDFALGFVFSSRLVTETLSLLGTQLERFFAGDFGAVAEGAWTALPTIFGNAYDAAEELWQRTMAVEGPVGDALLGVAEDAEKIETAVKHTARAVLDLEGAMRSLDAISTAAQTSGLDREELIQREYRARIDLINETISALERQGATEAQLAELEVTANRAALDSARDRDRALAEIADAEARDHADRMARIAEQAEQAARLSGEAAASAAADFRAGVEVAATSSADSFALMTQAIQRISEVGRKANRDAVMFAFRAAQAGGIAQTLVNAGVAIGRQYADLPLFAAIPASIFAGGAALAQAVAIAAQPPPAFHIGTRATRAPDETTATVTRKEVVLTTQGQDAANLNAGIRAAPQVIILDGHTASPGGIAREMGRAGSQLYAAARAGDLPGHSRRRR